MTRLPVAIHDDIVTVINKIKDINDSGVELEIPEGSVLFENILNLKLLEKEAGRLGKTLHLRTTDENGINLIKMINEKEEVDFSAREIDLEQEYEGPSPKKKTRSLKGKIPNPLFLIATPLALLNFKKLGKSKGLIIIVIILGIVGYAGYQTFWRVPKANVKIVVNSQPLTKSVQIKVVKDGETNKEAKTLKGSAISTTIIKTSSVDTTGEKLIGEKATGEVRIFNRTDEEVELKEDDLITFKDDDSDLNFVLDDDVTIPPESLQDPSDPTSPSIPGEAAVDITAEDIGEEYNIDDDETLEFEDYKKSELFAMTEGETKGGKSETVKIVAEEDRTTLSAQLFDEALISAEDELSNKSSGSKKFIRGSATTSINSELFDAEVEDEKDKLELTQEVYSEGLAYSENDLEKLLGDLLDDFYPRRVYSIFSR